MHSFQAGCEWFSRSQDGGHSAVAHKCNLNVLRRVNLHRVTADAGRGQHLGGIGRIVRNYCLFEHALLGTAKLGIG
ncbi:hypothetical protein SAMN05421736_10749 [Evansella caseinilytica]|uniref:Uncharacterized protein n=1 Tax=Evansella caseinilytica TaxID=1503961 RepID=A0A1H3QTI6_9BACI|nr:hypothetical protein [Evansella caseinilytica]SDZ16834.1 hypothetical protein SAMN05421736_10749 [Evansella caseinilytica]